MNEREMLAFLKETDEKLCAELEPFERVHYGELVGAPFPYCCQGDLMYGDPDLDMIYDIHNSINNYIEYLKACTATLASNYDSFNDR